MPRYVRFAGTAMSRGWQPDWFNLSALALPDVAARRRALVLSPLREEWDACDLNKGRDTYAAGVDASFDALARPAGQLRAFLDCAAEKGTRDYLSAVLAMLSPVAGDLVATWMRVKLTANDAAEFMPDAIRNSLDNTTADGDAQRSKIKTNQFAAQRARLFDLAPSR